MNESDRARLYHMLDAAREAISFGRGRTSDDLRHDRIIGEAASRISPEGRSGAPGIPWEKVTAMRNRSIHGYFDWNVEVIWSTLTSNLPDLVRELEYALSDRT